VVVKFRWISVTVVKVIKSFANGTTGSGTILNRSLSAFAMTMQLFAMDIAPHSVCGGAASLDFKHHSKSY